MKKYLLMLLIATHIFANEKFDEIFKDTNSTFVLYDLNKNKFDIYNKTRANELFSPASTFKIYNSLIALNLGVVKNVDEIFYHYNGEKAYLKSWEKDESLRSAIKVSNVLAYKSLARKIGLKNYQMELNKLDYGNKFIGDKVDEFWLNGDLKISAIKQVNLLTKLVKNELPFKYQNEVKEILFLKDLNNGKLYGKTGLFSGDGYKIGWFVGFFVTKDDTLIFALNITNPKDLKEREELVIKALNS